MEVSNFVFIFATNLINKNEMDKKNTEDLLAVDLQDYYHALKKRDKGKLLHFLMDKYGMAYTTIINKFAGRLEMSKADIVLFNLAVNDESLWKK